MSNSGITFYDIKELNEEEISFISKFFRRFKDVEEVRSTIQEMQSYIDANREYCKNIFRDRNTIEYIYDINLVVTQTWQNTLRREHDSSDGKSDVTSIIKNFFNKINNSGVEFSIMDKILYTYNVLFNSIETLCSSLEDFENGYYKNIDGLNDDYCFYAANNVFDLTNLMTGKEYLEYLD